VWWVNEVARIAIDDGVAYVAWPERGGEARSVRLDGAMLRDVRTRGGMRPVVGDWVEVSPDGIVLSLRPRRTRLARRAAGGQDVEQVIAANVDLAFVATAADGDVNERRLERYLALVRDGGVQPVILLTKADLCPDLGVERARVRSVAPGVDIVAVSAETGEGLAEVARRIAHGPHQRAPRGACVAALLGSSGVGKSTLVNRLLGETRQRVGDLRGDGKGRHTTTRREMVTLPGGGMLLDMPGMRELGLIDAGDGLEKAFAEVSALAERCRFRDCRHEEEPGCAVRSALEEGTIDAQRLASWRKLGEEIGARSKRRR
jgi:ribosome biogenesis GTPase / thiamine phosphate phosphatase